MHVFKIISSVALALLTLAGPAHAGQETGTIRVHSEPSAATVILDGVTRDITPLNLMDVPVGEHLVVVRKQGFKEARRSVTLLEGQEAAPVEIKLEPVSGLALIHSSPSDAEVHVSGTFRGRTPLLLTDFPLGTHQVVLSKSGFQQRTVELVLKDRVPRKLDVQLQSDSATLVLTSNPSGASVLINGAERGRTPCTVEAVAAGPNNIEMNHPDCYAFQERLVVRAGETRRFEASLRGRPSALSIISIPENGRVYIDGQFKGITPLNMSTIKPGTYRVRVDVEGYASASKTIEVKPTQRLTEEFRLDRNSGTLILVTEPAGVKVFIDGKFEGTTQAGGQSDMVSREFEVDLLSSGKHTLQLTKHGYALPRQSIAIEVDKVLNLHRKMNRLFIPDTMVRFGPAATDVYTGRLTRKHPNGDVELEVRPGATIEIPADTILQVRPLNDGETE